MINLWEFSLPTPRLLSETPLPALDGLDAVEQNTDPNVKQSALAFIDPFIILFVVSMLIQIAKPMCRHGKRWSAVLILLGTVALSWNGQAAAVVSDSAGDPHWAFVAPRRPGLPAVAQSEWVCNPIDRFVLARLEAQSLSPSSQAERTTLIRRVTLDLTGLPPSPLEVEAFLNDRAPGAYERLIDRLLASPRYGERMAVDWLDAARYADTHGYLFDTERSMWRWRDWVIDAFNQNLPFDDFSVRQLAGDLLPDPTLSERIASGFNRNHVINNEAGAIPQEYLVENLIDRVSTTATVWMGLTLGCCQCHDHKDDPLTQREFYEFYAFFNNIPERGLDGLNANAKPLIRAPTAIDRAALNRLEGRVASFEKQFRSLRPEIESAQSKWEASFEQTYDPPDDGLAAHWPLDRALTDTQNPDRTAVDEAAEIAYSEGVLGQAVALDGLGYVNAGDRFDLGASDVFSFAVWVRPKSKEGRQSVFSRMMDGKALFRGYTLQTFVGLPSFFLVNSFPDSLMQVQAKTALEPDQWVHLAVTYDGSGKAAGLKLYVNGEYEEPSVVLDQLSGPVTTDQPFWIGNGHPGAKFKGRIDDLRVYDRVLSDDEVRRLPGLSIDSLLAIEPTKRNEEQARRVSEFFLQKHAPDQWRRAHQDYQDVSSDLEKRRRAIPTVMVMAEQEKPRETRLLIRGAYDRPGEKVSAGTPSVLPAFSKELPKNRLGLARWLTDPGHPLTARVTINRIWQIHFGLGLVRTADDFGVQSEPPSHPELLDWLATEFIATQWNLKAMQRLIVTSATYRQSSKPTGELIEHDPENRWLARGPRQRLAAEQIRDQALGVSGLLVDGIGGPSVKPYQPPGLWREVAFDFSGANLTAQIYQQDTGERLFRRSLYTFWKRTAPPPNMLLFDAPDRERCVVRRQRTNTPLQALVLMNDPTFVEAARALAARSIREAGSDPEDQIAHAFRLVAARPPSARELQPLNQLYQRQLQRFGSDRQAAQALIAVGESPRRSEGYEAELAAGTVVAGVLLNLDETINRP